MSDLQRFDPHWNEEEMQPYVVGEWIRYSDAGAFVKFNRMKLEEFDAWLSFRAGSTEPWSVVLAAFRDQFGVDTSGKALCQSDEGITDKRTVNP